jgi:hypothetical protein
MFGKRVGAAPWKLKAKAMVAEVPQTGPQGVVPRIAETTTFGYGFY